MNRRRYLAIVLLGLASHAAIAEKKMLDHDAYDVWRALSDERISDSGEWLLYTLAPQDGDPVLEVRRTTDDRSFSLEGGDNGRFDAGSRYVVYTIRPKKDVVRQAKRDEVKKEEMPTDGLGILDLESGERIAVERVKNFALPEDGAGILAYLHEKRLKKDEEEKESEPTEAKSEGEAVAEVPEEQTEEAKKAEKKKEKKAEGTELIVRDLIAGTEYDFQDATEYRFSKDGRWMLYAASNKDGSADGMFAVNTQTGASWPVLRGEGEYSQIVADETGAKFAFLSNRDDYTADQPVVTLYLWSVDDTHAIAVVPADSFGVPEGWWLSEHRTPRFSKSGSRVYFGTAPRPAPEPDDEPLDDERVKLDIWNWRDPLLQPDQLVGLDDERKRSYLAVLDIDTGAVAQLGTEEIPSVELAAKGDAEWALGATNVPYRRFASWESPGFVDVHLVHTDNGDSRRILEKHQGSADLSPGGTYAYWWDRHEREWYASNVFTGHTACISSGIPHPLEDELNDRPMTPGAYGHGGWIVDDAAILVYDKHDVWICDPEAKAAPRCVTKNVGREHNLRFRAIDLDPESDFVCPDEPLLLSALDYDSKESGFYRVNVQDREEPVVLCMENARFGRPTKAKHAGVVHFTRETFRDFPDTYVSGLDFDQPRRMSHANPQQDEYRWGDAHLVEWRSADGAPLDGILYTPDDFDPARKYPLMVYFYERLSDNLHDYHMPEAGRSSISVSFYVSRGYLVFLPDVPYEIGYPGESALHAVVPGVLNLIDEGYVDKDRIGIQGHSWGGYQIAFMITRTNLFAAAEAGAPVSNMTSAYGGIRWSTGLSRMFQYERTQSRIGGSLWERPLQFIENSPLFWADKIQTPLLMLHNDEDGAVPWYQGIEMFVALRRLDKPVWMLNYNGEDHGLTKYVNKRDFAIRMQQFFDHYLLDAPPPVWMENGIPATEKGRDLGLDLITADQEP